MLLQVPSACPCRILRLPLCSPAHSPQPHCHRPRSPRHGWPAAGCPGAGVGARSALPTGRVQAGGWAPRAGAVSGLVPRLRRWDPRKTILVPGGLSPRAPRLFTEDALGLERKGTAVEVVIPVVGCPHLGARGWEHVCPPWRGCVLEHIPHHCSAGVSPASRRRLGRPLRAAGAGVRSGPNPRSHGWRGGGSSGQAVCPRW